MKNKEEELGNLAQQSLPESTIVNEKSEDESEKYIEEKTSFCAFLALSRDSTDFVIYHGYTRIVERIRGYNVFFQRSVERIRWTLASLHGMYKIT